MTEIASLGGREKARDSRQGERGTRRVACSGRIGKEKRCISLVGASERRRNRRGARGRKKPSYIMDASEMTEFQGGEKERGQRGRGKEKKGGAKVVERKGSVPDLAKSREQVPTSSCREVIVFHKPKRLYRPINSAFTYLTPSVDSTRELSLLSR
ncbi:hypothetical protein ALC60_09642 [Trachymyrmex zeteki]|uniref:Uncharacterized protein n=1 Tax=Mycetomoellerius zeteki TaxID=64791 RepID=A0A151WTS6_9HYME|nr:hypothetical protein ALC60_09642 [Trachymyrmex zeteki]